MDDKPSSADGTSRGSLLLPGVALAVGILARLLGAWWYRFSANPDYAVVVQMARHMAAGREWPTFFYGQSYMGTLEPSVSAALVALFGPNPFWVCLGTALFGMALLVSVHRWASRLAGPWAGAVAVVLASVGPVGYFQYMASPRGGYALGLWLTVFMLHEAAELAWLARTQGGLPVRRCLRLGLLGGLGFWNFWLTLPALATAGLLLVGSLGLRILRLRVWLPGALGFTLGSLPFWRWNAQHDWGSLREGAAGRGQVLHALRLLVTERLPLLLDVLDAPRAKTVAILGAHVVLLGMAVMAMWPRRRRRWTASHWTLAALLLYTAIYASLYALSSFSIPLTPRYLLPFVPLFAVLAGIAVARTWQTALAPTRSPNRLRTFGYGALALLGTTAALTVVTGHLWTLPRHVTKQPWVGMAREVSTRLIERGIHAAVGDYRLYGVNWAGDERLCVSSPWLERYPPFAQRLEREPNPAVLENYNGFDHFIAATGASVVHERTAGLRVDTDARPSELAARPIVTARWMIASMCGDRGQDPLEALTDLHTSTVATFAPSSNGTSTVEIHFAQPTTVCGLRAWIHADDRFGAWSVEGRSAGSDVFRELSPPHVPTGYFWSGPRFYLAGPDWNGTPAVRSVPTVARFPHGTQLREEKRFAPSIVESLRVRFHARGADRLVRLSHLQVLQPAGEAPALDVAAIADAVRTHGLRRVYSGRWLASELHRELGESVWTSRNRWVFGPDAGDPVVRLRSDTGIVAEPDAEATVRGALRALEVRPTERQVGGATLFLFDTLSPDQESYRGLRYADGLMTHAHQRALAAFSLERAAKARELEDRARDRSRGVVGRVEDTARERRPPRLRPDPPEVPLPATYFEDRLALLGLSAWPQAIRAGEELGFEVHWRTAPDFQCPRGTVLVVHFLRDGKPAFQMDAPLDLPTDAFLPSSEAEFRTYHSVLVPADLAPGPVTPVLGLLHPGLGARRLAADTELPTTRRRLVIPQPLEVTR